MSKPPHHHSPLLIEHEDTHFHNSFHAVIALEMQRPSDWDQEPEQVPKNSDPNLFTILPAQEWLKRANSRPIPKMLFGEFWFESELCILFADTNLGKSILAVQIGDSISRGIPIKGLKLQARKQSVLYFDFELSDKQFEHRYSLDYAQHYEFDNNFLRAEIDPDGVLPESYKTFEDFLNYSLELAIVKHKARVLIIDNLTYLRNETERAKEALPLMKHLKALKNRHGLSILCLAHTPKRDLRKPLTRNDLQGSKMLINFCDSCFAIGESAKDQHLRYIKQIKERSTEKLYGEDNVIIVEVNKPHNFLQFEFVGFDTEQAHLEVQTDKDKEDRIDAAIAWKDQGWPNTKIARELGVSEAAVRKWLKKRQNANDE